LLLLLLLYDYHSSSSRLLAAFANLIGFSLSKLTVNILYMIITLIIVVVVVVLVVKTLSEQRGAGCGKNKINNTLRPRETILR